MSEYEKAGKRIEGLHQYLEKARNERDHANDLLEWRTSERNQLDEENKELHEELKQAVKENERLKAALRVAFAQSKEAQVKVTISVALAGDLGCIPPGTEVKVEELTGIIVQMQSDIERITQERDEARAVCRGTMRAVKDYLEKHE